MTEKNRRHRRSAVLVPGDVIIALRAEAMRRGDDVETLVAGLLRQIVADDLFAAVLDQ